MPRRFLSLLALATPPLHAADPFPVENGQPPAETVTPEKPPPNTKPPHKETTTKMAKKSG